MQSFGHSILSVRTAGVWRTWLSVLCLLVPRVPSQNAQANIAGTTQQACAHSLKTGRHARQGTAQTLRSWLQKLVRLQSYDSKNMRERTSEPYLVLTNLVHHVVYNLAGVFTDGVQIEAPEHVCHFLPESTGILHASI